jgi:type II secretory pathway pseudopilin PulG
MSRRISTRGQKAFTIRELLATLAVLCALAWLAAPAVGSNRSASQSVLCLANMRLLSLALQLYAQENNDRFVPNYHGAGALNGGETAGWALGWLDWTTAPANTNIAYLRQVRYAKLAPYISASRNIHKCTADNALSGPQKARRWCERVRSVVLNGTFGPGNATSGPWQPEFVQIQSYSDLSRTRNTPATMLTFMEEHPDSINDPFIFPPRTSSWIDLPGAQHQGAGAVAFLDGRAEMHTWIATGRMPQVRFVFRALVPRPGDPDIAWFRAHSAMRR